MTNLPDHLTNSSELLTKGSAYTQFSISILSFLQTLHTRTCCTHKSLFYNTQISFFTTHTFLSKNTHITLYSAVISQDTPFPTYLNAVHTCVLFSTLFSNRMSVSTLITLSSSDCQTLQSFGNSACVFIFEYTIQVYRLLWYFTTVL